MLLLRKLLIHKLILAVGICFLDSGYAASIEKSYSVHDAFSLTDYDIEVVRNKVQSQIAFAYFQIQKEYVYSKQNNASFSTEKTDQVNFLTKAQKTGFVEFSVEDSESEFKIHTTPTAEADTLEAVDHPEIYGIKWARRDIVDFSVTSDHTVNYTFSFKPLLMAHKWGYHKRILYSGKAILMPSPEDGEPVVTLVREKSPNSDSWRIGHFTLTKSNKQYFSASFSKPDVETFILDMRDSFRKELMSNQENIFPVAPKFTTVVKELALKSLEYDSFLKSMYEELYANQSEHINYFQVGINQSRKLGTLGLRRLSIDDLDQLTNILGTLFRNSTTIQCENLFRGENYLDALDNLDVEDFRQLLGIGFNAIVAELENNPPANQLTKEQIDSSYDRMKNAVANNFNAEEMERLKRIFNHEPMYYPGYCSLISKFFNTILQIEMPERQWALRLYYSGDSTL